MKPIRAVGEGESSRDEAADDPDLNLRILGALAACIVDRFGEETLAAVAAAADLSPGDVRKSSKWIRYERFERLLVAAREYFADDDEFRAACGYRLDRGYGPMRLLFYATSPGTVYQRAFKSFSTISGISSTEITAQGRTYVRTRYRSTKNEHRLACLSRQGQATMLPRLWGLPRARLVEHSCIAWGDDTCEYEIHWYELARWLPSLAGLAVGGVAAWAALSFGLTLPVLASPLPVLGALVGYLYEIRRTNRANLRLGEDYQNALRDAMGEETETRKELLQMQSREREWSRLLEEQLEERSGMLQKVIGSVREIQDRRVVELRGLTHDIRNPLQSLSLFLAILGTDRDSALIEEMLPDQAEAIERITRILDGVLQTASSGPALVPLARERLDTASLVDVIRRRLRALCHARAIRISVLRSREAPEFIECDPLLVNRVIDNLLSNAAKYTQRGSIVVEVTGSPGFLTLKVSDTGKGIADDEYERVFQTGAPDPGLSPRESYGLGLNIVIQLLAQVGGRLEVMSLPEEGTTFWVHLPIEIQSPEDAAPQSTESVYGKVVTIRRKPASG